MEIINRYKLIIWDFDGTIINLYVNWQGLKKELIDMIKFNWQNTKKDNLSLNELIYLAERNISRDIIFRIIEKYELKADFSVNESLINIILDLYDRGIMQCILSDNMYKTIHTILSKLKIINFFDFIVSKDSVRRFKPDPEGLIKILRFYNINKSKILYIGDSWKDEVIADKVGLSFLYVEEFKK